MKTQKQREDYFLSIINSPDGDYKYLTSDLKKTILAKEGGKLYKYYDFDSFFDNKSKLDSFQNGKLWASTPLEFNDPYDCLAQVFLPRNNFLNPHEFLRQEIDGIEISCDNLSESDKKDLEQKINSLLKNLSSADLDKLCADNGIILPSILDDKKIANFWKEKYYVLCLTSNLRSILMWSHYSKNHTGFCLEFDPDKIIFSIEDYIKKEVYGERNRSLSDEQKEKLVIELNKESRRKVESLYPVCYFDDVEKYRTLLSGKIINKAALLKYKDWSYENEWRIVYPKEGEGVPKDRNFFEANPEAIYLGCEFQEEGEKQKKFLKIVKSKGIKTYKMHLKNDFTLDYRTIHCS